MRGSSAAAVSGPQPFPDHFPNETNRAAELRPALVRSRRCLLNLQKADGMFTLEEVECLAHCDKAPCLQVNYRFFGPVTPDDFDRLCDDLRSHRLERDVPRHGVLNRDTRPHPMSAARDGT